MKVKELIKTLKKLEPNDEIVFYHLKNSDLTYCVYETILDIHEPEGESFVEFTIQDYEDYKEENGEE